MKEPLEPQEPRLVSVPGIDTTVSHSARIWDYWLGGKENYAVDRELGDQIAGVLPDIVEQARADRLFLRRVVRFLVEQGVRQFLDIGTGLPTVDNTHEVAQRIRPDARIVYVDNDPLVLTHARALLSSTPEGATAYLDADMREPDMIIDEAEETLDLSQPVAVTMLGVVWHLTDDQDAHQVIDGLMRRLVSGSYLAIAHPTIEVTGQKMVRAIEQWNQFGKPPGVHRTPQQIESLFQGLELVAPGVVSCTRWKPEATPFGEPAETDQFCGVARKP
ncbi:SAM-dependent methyltransferase [Actinomadura geliboluensis]|uniref:SAM-dependent methyltransferase n=1 Tax=Actinomadura geliboluensis TaxID=882440 RepID=A0A5S4H690_9ACTN|nr:SAM-dependent methyltransferase [Actinomadura geliboluensis]